MSLRTLGQALLVTVATVVGVAVAHLDSAGTPPPHVEFGGPSLDVDGLATLSKQADLPPSSSAATLAADGWDPSSLHLATVDDLRRLGFNTASSRKLMAAVAAAHVASGYRHASGASGFKASTPYQGSSGLGANGLVPPTPRSLEARVADRFNVRDFGALGDGSGLTPADTHTDVASEEWNNWELYPFYTNHDWSEYWQNPAGKFIPPRPQPFLDSDTWDSIGINLAIWTAANKGEDFCGGLGPPLYNRPPTGGNCSMGEVFIPSGNYQINVDGGEIKIMKGMEVSIRGAGMYHTTLQAKENASFFSDPTRTNGKQLFELIDAYRPGGPPTYIEDLALMGCQNYSPSSHNLVGVKCTNTNGLFFKGIWFTAMDAGISMQDHSGELFIDECVTEYTFSGLVHLLDNSCDAWVRNCNIHSSSADPYAVGVNSNGGNILVHDCKLVGFYGPAIIANTGRVSAQGNMLWDGAALVSGAGNGSIISGNFIKRPAVRTPGSVRLRTASPQPSLISLSGHGITVNNNNIDDSGLAGSILDIGNSTAVLVSSNVLETSDAHADTRWAITARNSSSAFISGNMFVKEHAIQPGIPGLVATNNWIAGTLKTDDGSATTAVRLVSAPPHMEFGGPSLVSAVSAHPDDFYALGSAGRHTVVGLLSNTSWHVVPSVDLYIRSAPFGRWISRPLCGGRSCDGSTTATDFSGEVRYN
jgi:hypothetical protein